MKNSELKNLLKQEIEEINLPMSKKLKDTKFETKNDILDFQEAPKKKQKSSFFKIAFSSFCLIVAICFGLSLFLIKNNNTKSELTSFILSINPEICITTDSSNSVVSAFSLNQDGNDVLNDEMLDLSQKMELDDFIKNYIFVLNRDGILRHEAPNQMIKLYAINNKKSFAKDQCKSFDDILDKELKNYGFYNYHVEDDLMSFQEFRDKVGINNNHNDLDKMRDDLLHHQRFYNPEPIR